MSSNQKHYTAEFFKKDMKIDESDITTNDIIESKNNSEHDSFPEFSSDCDEDAGSEYDDDTESSLSGDDCDEDFNNEDKLISRLYREVVDEIMQLNKLREFEVNIALDEMKHEISQGHIKGFRRFRGINFNKSENCCGYLRRYAVCHTGLVKKIMWRFFKNKTNSMQSKFARNEIIEQNHLKVVSLGGGPGNDLVGFCCALQEIVNSVKELDLYVIDICEGWRTVFPTILHKAAKSNFGSFSQYVKKIKINFGFMSADLTAEGTFENELLSTCLAEADIVFMVKLTSFLPEAEAGDLIHNVVDCMNPEAKLIFIDQPYNGDLFTKMEALNFIYHDQLRYELSFKPAKFQSPSIPSTQAHVGIYEKTIPFQEDSDEEN